MTPNILLCCSGSVATLKVPELVVELAVWANVLVVGTRTSRHFLLSSQKYNPGHWDKFLQLGGLDLCLFDEHEW